MESFKNDLRLTNFLYFLTLFHIFQLFERYLIDSQNKKDIVIRPDSTVKCPNSWEHFFPNIWFAQAYNSTRVYVNT